MFINRRTNQKINRLQERSLRILYQDNISTFEELLRKYNYVTVHTRNLQLLATEMCKVHKNISQNFICDIFPKSDVAYNSRNNKDFVIPLFNSVFWGSETLRIMGPKIWNLLSLEIEETNNLELFTSKIKLWKPQDFPCRLCQTFLPGIGFS